MHIQRFPAFPKPTPRRVARAVARVGLSATFGLAGAAGGGIYGSINSPGEPSRLPAVATRGLRLAGGAAGLAAGLALAPALGVLAPLGLLVMPVVGAGLGSAVAGGLEGVAHAARSGFARGREGACGGVDLGLRLAERLFREG